MIVRFLDLLMPYSQYSYWIIFLVLIICGFGVPIPEDITLVVGGIASAYKITNFWITLVVCMAGVLIGDSIIFLLGRFFGSKLLKTRFFAKVIKRRRVALARWAFKKYGNYLIFFARFMPGLRTPMFFSIGMFKRPFYIFFLIDGFASLISVPVWIYVGHVFGENIPLLEKYVRKMEHGILFTLFAVIILFVLFHVFKKRFMKFFLKDNQLKK